MVLFSHTSLDVHAAALNLEVVLIRLTFIRYPAKCDECMFPERSPQGGISELVKMRCYYSD